MSFLKSVAIFCAVLAVCYCGSPRKCDNIDHKPHDHHHKHHNFELYWHGFYYLAFLVLKFKAIFVLGSIFTVGLLIGKIFAIFKFAEYMKKTKYADHHEKIVYSHGPSHDYTGGGGFSSPGGFYGKSYSGGGDASHDSFPPDFSIDQLPPNAQISGGDGNYNGQSYASGPGQAYPSGPDQLHGSGSSLSQVYAPPYGQKRSSNIEQSTIDDIINTFNNLIKKSNITNMAFDDMNLKTDECRKKFVCEADFNFRESVLLKSAIDIFSDETYSRYRTKQNITSLDECGRLYPTCLEKNI